MNSQYAACVWVQSAFLVSNRFVR